MNNYVNVKAVIDGRIIFQTLDIVEPTHEKIREALLNCLSYFPHGRVELKYPNAKNIQILRFREEPKNSLRTYRFIKGTDQYGIMKSLLDGFPNEGFDRNMRLMIPELELVHIGCFTGREGSDLITFYSKDDLEYPWLKRINSGRKKVTK
jgi:hypothetical protein